MITPRPTPQPFQVTAERIKRFERLGGVNLARHEWEDPIHAQVHAGTQEYDQALFDFQCLTCGNRVRSNQEMEPLCTGPDWMDTHEPKVMSRIWRKMVN